VATESYRAATRHVLARVMAENAALRRNMPPEHTVRGVLAHWAARRIAGPPPAAVVQKTAAEAELDLLRDVLRVLRAHGHCEAADLVDREAKADRL
jgi:hypothetical protein